MSDLEGYNRGFNDAIENIVDLIDEHEGGIVSELFKKIKDLRL